MKIMTIQNEAKIVYSQILFFDSIFFYSSQSYCILNIALDTRLKGTRNVWKKVL